MNLIFIHYMNIHEKHLIYAAGEMFAATVYRAVETLKYRRSISARLVV